MIFYNDLEQLFATVKQSEFIVFDLLVVFVFKFVQAQVEDVGDVEVFWNLEEGEDVVWLKICQYILIQLRNQLFGLENVQNGIDIPDVRSFQINFKSIEARQNILKILALY